MPELIPLLLACAKRTLSSLAEREESYEALVACVMRTVVARSALARGLVAKPSEMCGRLFARPLLKEEIETRVAGELSEFEVPYAELTPEEIGELFEGLLSTQRRKQSGSFYTPRALTKAVAESALSALRERPGNAREGAAAVSICDPALGAGAFLLAAGEELAEELVKAAAFRGSDALGQARRHVALRCLHGVDLNPLAVAVAEAALWLFVGDASLTPQQVGRGLRHGNALIGEPAAVRTAEGTMSFDWATVRAPAGMASFDWPREFPEIFSRGGFDLVIGNPPWVAYAGRAAQPLEPRLKAYYSKKYAALRGYPTLHGLFVERATELAPRGVIALVLPSPIADLDGYRAVRRALTRLHRVVEPLLEFGQDAFASVTQPCFALLATPSSAETEASDSIWTLCERQRLAGAASEIAVPGVLRRLAEGPSLPPELFGEMGFQTTRDVSQRLLCRSAEPPPTFSYPLLEGRDVQEFREGRPRLFLNPDAEVLKRSRCRLRSETAYEAVHFVVRQTAKVTIAALHRRLPFRNTLLAGFSIPEFPPELCVGLLNSALYRAYHLSLRRDARQAVFPQVKIGHLRALPRPPEDPAARARIVDLTVRATEQGIDPELRAALDCAVFDLFQSSATERREISVFLKARAPELGHGPAC